MLLRVRSRGAGSRAASVADRRRFGVRVKKRDGSGWRWARPSWFKTRKGFKVARKGRAKAVARKLRSQGRVAKAAVPRPLRESKRDKLVAIALREVGVAERPHGSNSGPRVEEYQRSTTLGGTGWPWCQAFVCWCARQAGFLMPYRGAYVPHFEAWAREHGRWERSGGRGMAAVFHFGSGEAKHVEIVLRVDGDHVETVGGNTSPGEGGSQDNGGGVYQRRRPLAHVKGFVRLK